MTWSHVTRRTLVGTAASVLLCCMVGSMPAAEGRVLPEGRRPDDVRLGPLKDLDGYFPFEVPNSKEAWETRAAELRQRVRVATGLWPMPERTPLHAQVFGRVEREGFTVEKVYFESLPGHFVTGSLFRPTGKSGRLPAVLSPHGHGGRTQEYDTRRVREMIVKGQERFEGSGRFTKLARCAQLARMGCVTFIYDMLGYADSVQISRALAHGYKTQRPAFETPESWGFFSTQAELRLQTIMGLQTWNAIRALDFLCGLPDVDPKRIGVTGGSGGGTQTILLCAIDSRPIVAFPQGMVSTAMQGGCTCENCNLLRIGTGNVELAALFAPKPQGMTAADDWTQEMMTKGYPELRRLYAMLGVERNVRCDSMLQFPHNYNYVTRAVMYSWMNKHLKLGLEEPIVEEDYRVLSAQEYTVWDEAHPRPKGGGDYERSLVQWMNEQSHRSIPWRSPGDALGWAGWADFREVVGGGFATILGRSLSTAGDTAALDVTVKAFGDVTITREMIRNRTYHEELPTVVFSPKGKDNTKDTVIWVDGEGKARLFDDRGEPAAHIARLVDAGMMVFGADLLYQGEFLADGIPLSQTRVVENPRPYAGYTFTYNHTLFAQRVHDILSVISFVGRQGGPSDRLHLVGVNGAGPLVAAAKAQAGDAVDSVAVDTEGFRFSQLTRYRDPMFLPGSVKYGDLPALLALCAPEPLWLAGENGEIPDVTAAAYGAAGYRNRVTSRLGSPTESVTAITDWLLASR